MSCMQLVKLLCLLVKLCADSSVVTGTSVTLYFSWVALCNSTVILHCVTVLKFSCVVNCVLCVLCELCVFFTLKLLKRACT